MGLKIKLFLEVKVEDEFKECGQIISEIFEEYILSTVGRLNNFFFSF